MNRALFLDRDGVINEDGSYLSRPEDIRFLDGIFFLCRTAQERGYRIIIVTNQSGIAQGYYTEDDFSRLTKWMCREFQAHSVTVERVYYCPYHPEKGIGKYKVDSDDRKPKPGMILRARDEFDLDLQKSILIGDRDSDMEAGWRAGVGTLLLLPEKYAVKAGKDVHILHSLCEAERFL